MIATRRISRVVNETGNPITGSLKNVAGTLADAIPEGSVVTVTGTDVSTGMVRFQDSPVTIADFSTLSFSYAPQSADWSAPCTVRLRFKAVRPDNLDVYIPDDDRRFALELVIIAP